MNIISAHFKGFKTATRFPRMLLVMYVVNLLLSLLVALPFFDILNNNAGHSLAIDKLLKGFDFSVLQNIINNSGDAFFALKSQIKWVGIIYLILNVFFAGGIYEIASTKKFSVSAFFGGCGRYFFRMLFLTLLFLASHVLLLAIFIIPVTNFYGLIFNTDYQTDTHYKIFAGLVALYFIFFGYLLMVSDYAKSYLVAKKSVNFLKAYFKGIGFVLRHFIKTSTLFVLLIILPIGFFALYFYVDGVVEFKTKYMILFTVALQQIFIISRIWFKVWILSAQYEMYVDDSAKDEIRAAERKKLKEQQQKQEEIKEKETVAKQKVQKTAAKKITKIEQQTKEEVAKIEEKTETVLETVATDFEQQQRQIELEAQKREAEISKKTKDDDLLEFG